MKNILIDISKYKPCNIALDYYNSFNSTKEAWENCHRGNWMLWLAFHLQINIKTLTLTKAYCAKTVYHLLKDDRSRNAIVTAINFGRGLATKEELDNAANAAHKVTARGNTAFIKSPDLSSSGVISFTYAATATDTAAYAAAYSTDITLSNAIYTSDTATYTANAAYTAAYNAAAAIAANATTYIAANAKLENQKKTADICRKYLTKEVFKILNL